MKRILLVIVCLAVVVVGGVYIYMNDRDTIDYSNEMFVDRSDMTDGYASMHTIYKAV